jgi:hypothetical protein
MAGESPLKDAQTGLDEAVIAYGFSAKKTFCQLLNQSGRGQADGRGESVTGPGVPQGFPNSEELVTDDCIRP